MMMIFDYFMKNQKYDLGGQDPNYFSMFLHNFHRKNLINFFDKNYPFVKEYQELKGCGQLNLLAAMGAQNDHLLIRHISISIE